MAAPGPIRLVLLGLVAGGMAAESDQVTRDGLSAFEEERGTVGAPRDVWHVIPVARRWPVRRQDMIAVRSGFAHSESVGPLGRRLSDGHLECFDDVAGEFVGSLQGAAAAVDFEFASGELTGWLTDLARRCSSLAGGALRPHRPRLKA